MDAKFFVGGLPDAVMDSQLRHMFASCGEVTSVQVIMDKLTGKSRGFGFVEMSTIEEAQNAISVWNDQVYEGRPLVVTLLVNETTIPRDCTEGSGPAPRRELDNA
jgi:RNA recognition motif-containing protein